MILSYFSILLLIFNEILLSVFTHADCVIDVYSKTLLLIAKKLKIEIFIKVIEMEEQEIFWNKIETGGFNSNKPREITHNLITFYELVWELN